MPDWLNETKSGFQLVAPAYRNTPRKGIILENGNRMNYGQLFPAQGEKPKMTTQRPLNTAYSARIGAEKRTPDAPIKPGMKRQTAGETAAYHHGVSVDDTPNVPLKDYEKAAPIHPGMTAKQKAGVDPVANDPKRIFAEAAKLGRRD